MIAVGVQFGASGAVSEVVVNTLQVAVAFPSVTAAASGEHDFLTTGASSYLFDGTVQAFNPNAISLIGKTVKPLVADGLTLNPLAPDYSLNSTTGLLSITKTYISGTHIYFKYST